MLLILVELFVVLIQHIILKGDLAYLLLPLVLEERYHSLIIFSRNSYTEVIEFSLPYSKVHQGMGPDLHLLRLPVIIFHYADHFEGFIAIVPHIGNMTDGVFQLQEFNGCFIEHNFCSIGTILFREIPALNQLKTHGFRKSLIGDVHVETEAVFHTFCSEAPVGYLIARHVSRGRYLDDLRILP